MSFKNYLTKYKFYWLIIGVLNVLCHGSMLLSDSIGIDTEAIIAEELDFYKSWLYTGRPGLVLLKYVFDAMSFNPYLTGIGTIAFITLNCILWTYLFFNITGKENKFGILVFSSIFSVHSIITEYFYFKLLSMEAAFCFCLIAVSVLLAHRFSLYKKWINFFIAIPLAYVAFSSYQAMNGLWLFGAVACFFLYYYFQILKRNDTIACKQLWLYIGRFIAVFLSAFLLNQFITKLFFSGSTYLDSQFRWGKDSVRVCLMNILDFIIKVMKGEKFFFVKTFPAYIMILIVLCGIMLFCYRKQHGKYLGVGVLFLLILSPFFLNIVLGGETVIRSMLILPHTLAFMAYILYLFDFSFMQKKFRKIVIIAFTALNLFTAYTQMRYTLLLNYTDDVRYQGDIRLANSLIEEINKLQDEEYSYPLVFIGSKSSELNPSCIYGECIGYSIFEWDTDVNPKNYYSTKRIVGFMNTMGLDYEYATKEDVIEMTDFAIHMESWPKVGSIKIINDILVIKLSD